MTKLLSGMHKTLVQSQGLQKEQGMRYLLGHTSNNNYPKIRLLFDQNMRSRKGTLDRLNSNGMLCWPHGGLIQSDMLRYDFCHMVIDNKVSRIKLP